MKRYTPMRRSGFKPPARARVRRPTIIGVDHGSPNGDCAVEVAYKADGTYEVVRILRPDPAPAVMARSSGAVVATPKHEYVRSPALIEVARLLPCQHCGANGPDAGVCAAHSNWHPHAKGGGIKADDNRIASLCALCHYEIDQGKNWRYEFKQWVWWHAHVPTVNLLVLRGFWPKGVPVPETGAYPAEWTPPPNSGFGVKLGAPGVYRITGHGFSEDREGNIVDEWRTDEIVKVPET